MSRFFYVSVKKSLPTYTLRIIQFTDRYFSGGFTDDLWNVGQFLPVCTTKYFRRQPSSYFPPWEPKISDAEIFLLKFPYVIKMYCKFKLHARYSILFFGDDNEMTWRIMGVYFWGWNAPFSFPPMSYFPFGTTIFHRSFTSTKTHRNLFLQVCFPFTSPDTDFLRRNR